MQRSIFWGGRTTLICYPEEGDALIEQLAQYGVTATFDSQPREFRKMGQGWLERNVQLFDRMARQHAQWGRHELARHCDQKAALCQWELDRRHICQLLKYDGVI